MPFLSITGTFPIIHFQQAIIKMNSVIFAKSVSICTTLSDGLLVMGVVLDFYLQNSTNNCLSVSEASGGLNFSSDVLCIIIKEKY